MSSNYENKIEQRVYQFDKPGYTVNGCRTFVDLNGGGSGGNCGSGPFDMEDGGEIIEKFPFAAISCKRPAFFVR
jgi:hypothetical protein